jgi:succinate dehydrogenase membrane anchor subunit
MATRNQRIASARAPGVRGGAGAWTFIGQRASALALLVLGPWFALAAPLAARGGYESVRAFFAQPVNALTCVVLVLAACLHMYLGVTEIIEDYLDKPAGRNAALTLNAVVCLLAAAIGVVALAINLRT